MIWLAVLFALGSAATTALSTSTQHLSTGKAEVGTERVRIRVGPSATHRPGTSAPVEREVRAGAGGGFLYGGGLDPHPRSASARTRCGW